MRIKDTGMIRKYQKANKNRNIWHMFVRAVACLVVFCTTYALILPVITLEKEYICGMEEHIHSDSCYAEDGLLEGNSPKLICSQTEHIHTSSCYPPKKNINKSALQSVGAGSPATLTLKFTSWGPWNPIEFPQGNTYNCEVGSTVTITLDDYNNQGVSYKEPNITVSGCTVVSVSCTCDQGHTSHNGWSNCGMRHEIVLRITDATAQIKCSVGGSDWPKEGNSVVISGSGVTETTTPAETVAPTNPPQTEPKTEPTTEPPVVVRPGYPTAVKTGTACY